MGMRSPTWINSVVSDNAIGGCVEVDKLEEETEKMAAKICLLPKDGIAIGKCSNHLICDTLGLTKGWAYGYITHTLFTNLRFEPGEYNFVSQRKQEGTRTGFHERDERYQRIK